MIAPSCLRAAPVGPPQPAPAQLRIATPADDAFVEDLQALAFGPGRFARTAFRVRERFPIDKSSPHCRSRWHTVLVRCG